MLDYIIVGQGICGSNLAIHLENNNKTFRIIDDGFKTAACLVAAGVINPITGKRMVKTWKSEVAHPYAKNFYKNLEATLNEKFFYDKKILQLCKSNEEIDLWKKRKADEDYTDFLKEQHSAGTFENLNDNYGSFFIEHSAWVEPHKIMFAYKKYFQEKKLLIEKSFDYAKLEICDGFFKYEDLSAKNIVFSEGYKIIENPYFNELKNRPTKGEILTIESDVNLDDYIIHKEKWIMKSAPNQYRIGSTWDKIDFESDVSSEAKEQLQNAIKNILGNVDYQIIDHTAGIRPCTASTKPHKFAHKNIANMFLFNGFGSKGYALSPYYAKVFTQGEEVV